MRRNRAIHSSSSNRLTVLGFLAAPVLTLALGITLNSSGPQIARASDPLDSGPQTDLRPLPERTRPEALDTRSATIAQLPIPNPLYYPERRASTPDKPTPKPEPVPDKPAPEPEFKLPAPCVVTAILRGRDGTVRALIDGSFYAAGDEFAPGWTVHSIDTTQRTVTLLQPDGKQRTIQMDQD